ncbi:GTPase, partial [Kitasatospora nipponensis]|uniref:GTPase n=1 Tax=Kitasatospora nipponensis TaxID=258049 RepID=UPI0031E41A8B
MSGGAVDSGPAGDRRDHAEPLSTAPAAGELVALTAALCRQLDPLLPPGATADAVRALRARLAEPGLRVAVGGRMGVGKTTLVNALLARRLAASAATECTTVVARFRAGPQNRVRVRLRDGGARWTAGRPGGGIPRDPRALRA